MVTQQEQPAKPKPKPKPKHQFKFTGTFGETCLLILKNTLFTIFTLGLYIPYARTNMRKYVWRSTKLAGHPFLFHADPKNLLKGYAILAGIALASYGAVVVGSSALPKFKVLFGLVPWLLIFAFTLRARYMAYAYLLNNTSYRSIRFQVRKDAVWEYMGRILKDSFLIVFTLGLYLPCSLANLSRIKWQNTSFGNIPLKFEMKNWDFALHCYKGFFMCVITFGIYAPWYAVSVHNFKMKHLSIMGAKVQSTATGTGLIWLTLKSSAFMLLSLGLAAPYIMNMNLAYYIDHLCLKGDIDFEAIVQSRADQKDHSFSESVAEAFDLDVDVA